MQPNSSGTLQVELEGAMPDDLFSSSPNLPNFDVCFRMFSTIWMNKLFDTCTEGLECQFKPILLYILR